MNRRDFLRAVPLVLPVAAIAAVAHGLSKHRDSPKFARREATAACKIDLSRARIMSGDGIGPLLFGSNDRLYLVAHVMDDRGQLYIEQVTVPVEIGR